MPSFHAARGWLDGSPRISSIEPGREAAPGDAGEREAAAEAGIDLDDLAVAACRRPA